MFRVKFANGEILEDPNIKNIINAFFHYTYYDWVSGWIYNSVTIQKWDGVKWIDTPYILNFIDVWTENSSEFYTAEFLINNILVRTVKRRKVDYLVFDEEDEKPEDENILICVDDF